MKERKNAFKRKDEFIKSLTEEKLTNFELCKRFGLTSSQVVYLIDKFNLRNLRGCNGGKKMQSCKNPKQPVKPIHKKSKENNLVEDSETLTYEYIIDTGKSFVRLGDCKNLDFAQGFATAYGYIFSRKVRLLKIYNKKE